MKENRIGIIKDLVEKNGRMSLEQLGERFPNVSSMTLRRDLLSLEESGVLVRVRGGAVSVQELSKKTEDQYSRRAAIQVAEKKQIAEKAVRLVEPGTSLFIDSGSTALYFAKELPDLSYFISTNGITIAQELMRKKMPVVTLFGGEVSRSNMSTIGQTALTDLERINIDTAIMAATAFTEDGHFCCGLFAESEIKKNVCARVKKRIMLLDTSKVGKVMPYTFATLSDIDILVTDNNFPQELKEKIIAQGVTVI